LPPRRLTNGATASARRAARSLADRARRAFSMIEMLIALTIMSTILSATLVAFDSMYKVYDTATESASNHVVARIAVNRLLGMIRTGSDFGPFPADVLDRNWNPLQADYFEFATAVDHATGEITEVTRVEYRFVELDENGDRVGDIAGHRVWRVGAAPALPDGVSFNDDDMDGFIDGVDVDDDPQDDSEDNWSGELWLVVIDQLNATQQEFLMLSDVRSATFALEYDIGPRLVRGTVDITFQPTLATDTGAWTPATPQSVRLVASAMPRRSIDDD
jgi:prepilin-type N-terminal cleavage/methylation domain-containing protein